MKDVGVTNKRNDVYEPLRRYFNILSKTGYVPYNNVTSLLVLLFINDLSEEDLSTEDRYIVNEALNCLYGSNCILDLQGCSKGCV